MPSWISWKLQEDCSELLVCCSTEFSGPIRKISACSELILTYKWCSLKINDGHFGRNLEFLGQLQGNCPELLVCYSTDIPWPISKLLASSEVIQAYKWCSLKMMAFWTPSWISWKAAERLSRTLRTLFYRYSWTNSENVSFFWGKSSIQAMFFENDGHFGRHLEFLGSSRVIVQNF